ncbi:HAMP domain-containing sensor histidine kinase [Desulfovibrio sp. JC010]|uniref:sensor histidine kinase n=1 Tax=Desulfovibrio sp. JC010 TaxID=2593641 RepID=UPI0013D389AE|nr:HAMP domain-containing sensor histidine kinase [Desulfovibrio sp. JC010]NDV28798.1 HAMP domain-containing histidine kinase [Desulfovibrio sp. JC010]
MLSVLEKIKGLSGLRLVRWYFVVFGMSTLLLFLISNIFFDSYLTRVEREQLSNQAETYHALYNTNGIDGLLAMIRNRHLSNRFSNIFLRLSDNQGKTVWLTIPEEFNELEVEHFILPTANDKTWKELDLPTENDLDIYTTHLADGHILQLGRTTGRQEMIVDDQRIFFLVIICGIAVLGILGGVFFSRNVLTPVRELESTVRRVSSGDMKSRVPVVEQAGELRELAVLFNKMLERNDKLISAMRDTLGNVSHDLKTPMTRMKARIEHGLIADFSAQQLREILMDCAEDVERINRQLNMLMDITEAETGQMKLSFEDLLCSSLIDEVLDIYEFVAEEREIEIINDSTLLTISGDHQRILQMLGNLVDNSLKYTPRGGKVALRTERDGDSIIISVEDSGPGIEPLERERIFEKLYRIDKSRSTKGLGLGLSLAKAVMEAHGGNISIQSSKLGGALFEVSFPCEKKITRM